MISLEVVICIALKTEKMSHQRMIALMEIIGGGLKPPPAISWNYHCQCHNENGNAGDSIPVLKIKLFLLARLPLLEREITATLGECLSSKFILVFPKQW